MPRTGFWRTAATDPDRTAVIDGEGRRTTYGELAVLVNRISHGLTGAGLRPGGTVAVVLGNRVEWLAVTLAGFQNGLHVVPVNWHLTAEEIGYILADSDAALVVTEPAYVPAVGAAADAAGIGPGGRLVVGTSEPLTGPPTGPLAGPPTGFAPLADLVAGRPADPPADRRVGSLLLYTSGTTGRPKGVRRPLPEVSPEDYFDLVRDVLALTLRLPAGDEVHLVTAPMYHSAPGSHALFAINLGHTVVLAGRFAPHEVLALVERHRVTNTFMVPTMFHRMLALPEPERAGYDTSSLRQVYHSAAACPVEVKRAVMAWLGPVVYEYYGSTECGPVAIAYPDEWLARPGTVGRPPPGVDLKIYDDAGRELPTGQEGMIYARGGMRFTYHKDPDKTARSTRGEYYAPGDIGYLDPEGYLYLRDRRDDLIISGGVNIYPAEVEAALLTHPAVGDVAVIGTPDEEWGQRVVALVEPASAPAGPELAAELLAHLGGRLARFKHPRVIEFRAALPRTPTGKLSRGRLRAQYLADAGEAGITRA